MRQANATLRAITRWGAAAVLVFSFVPSIWAVQHDIRGVGQDPSGAVVATARVTLHADGQELSRTTQPDGTFLFSGITADSATIEVSAAGFASNRIDWHPGDHALTIKLAPATVQQSLDVTATRTSILPTGVDDVESQPDAAVIS